MTYPTLNPTINFPKPLEKNPDRSGNVFPSDLVTGKGFYTQIQFVNYSISQQNPFVGRIANPTGGIKLPIPMKLNDNLIMQWSPVSYTDTAINALKSGATAAGGPAGTLLSSGLLLASQFGGIATGTSVNPLLFLQFQKPELRQFSLSWFLTPRNKQESDSIKKIITLCKKAASPERTGSMFLFSYPQVALIKMHPGNLYGHLRFKPCIITSVQANYSAGPVPAFHKNGAPALVSLTLNLMEMQFWFRSEIT
jgi:hypothetical protein